MDNFKINYKYLLMKKIFSVFLLSVVSISLFAQVDSVWTEQRGGKFFSVILHFDENGEGGFNYKLIGDTSDLSDYYGNAIKSEIKVLGGDVQIVRQYQKRLLQLATHIADMKTKFGFSIQDTVALQIPDLLTAGVWQIEGKDIRFRKNAASGKYQYKIDTTLWRPAEILPGAIVLRSYLRSGYTEILWGVAKGNAVWKSMNGETTLSKIHAARSELRQEEEQVFVLNTDGTIVYEGQRFKYDRGKKKWVQF